VQARLAPLTTGTLQVRVEGRTGSTPYARWLSMLGLWPLWLLAVGGLVAMCWRSPRGTPSAP
jgi:apolipoprotein N-acyltransferase